MAGFSKTSPQRDLFIQKLKKIILDNLDNEKFNVETFAAEIGTSRSNLHRKLKRFEGKSVSQFIKEVRLEEAQRILQNENATASEVSYRVGFNSPSYFNTCFKDYFGYPPGEANHKMELAKASHEEMDLHKPDRFLKKNHAVFIWLSVAIILLSALFVVYNLNGSISKKLPSIPEEPKTIAVLPLKNWSGDSDMEHVSDGVTDAIISKLSTIEDMERVIPFTSIAKYKNSRLSIPEIAKELDVAFVLEGSFKLAGDRLQCKVNLIDVENNTIVWTEEYNRTWESENIFQMQAHVAKSVADNLELDLNNDELSSIQYVQTENTEAYNLYLRGNYQYEKFSLDGFKNATTLFEKAIALDSTFFLPYLGIAESYLLMGFVWGGEEKEVAFKNAKKYYELASKYYNTNYREHWESLRQLKMDIDFNINWDFEPVYNELMSNGVDGRYGFDMARKFGEFRLALKIAKNSKWYYNGNELYYLAKAQVYMLLGENNEALALLEELDLLTKYNYFYLMESAKIYYYLNEMAKSKQQMEKFLKLYNNNPAQILWLAAVHSEMEGDMNRVNDYLNLLEIGIEKKQAGSPAWFLAMYYCHIRDYDKAFEWLYTSYDLHEVEMTWLKEEPLLHPLRDDPRYIELYKKVGFSKVFPIATPME